MKVWELREALAGVNDDALVVNGDGDDVHCEGYRMVREPFGGSYPAFVLDVPSTEAELRKKGR